MKTKERELARKLRREQGLSLNEIAAITKCSKSSISLWVRNVPLQKAQADRLAKHMKNKWEANRHKGTLTMQANYRKVRDAAFQKGVTRLSNDTLFAIICSIYWGEGSKKQRGFSISNCDSDMINFVSKWLITEGYRDRIILSVTYYEKKISEHGIRSYWQNQLSNLDELHINQIYIRKLPTSSKGKQASRNRQPYGTAVLSCWDVKLLNEILGGIHALKGLAK